MKRLYKWAVDQIISHPPLGLDKEINVVSSFNFLLTFPGLKHHFAERESMIIFPMSHYVQFHDLDEYQDVRQQLLERDTSCAVLLISDISGLRKYAVMFHSFSRAEREVFTNWLNSPPRKIIGCLPYEHFTFGLGVRIKVPYISLVNLTWQHKERLPLFTNQTLNGPVYWANCLHRVYIGANPMQGNLPLYHMVDYLRARGTFLPFHGQNEWNEFSLYTFYAIFYKKQANHAILMIEAVRQWYLYIIAEYLANTRIDISFALQLAMEDMFNALFDRDDNTLQESLWEPVLSLRDRFLELAPGDFLPDEFKAPTKHFSLYFCTDPTSIPPIALDDMSIAQAQPPIDTAPINPLHFRFVKRINEISRDPRTLPIVVFDAEKNFEVYVYNKPPSLLQVDLQCNLPSSTVIKLHTTPNAFYDLNRVPSYGFSLHEPVEFTLAHEITATRVVLDYFSVTRSFYLLSKPYLHNNVEIFCVYNGDDFDIAAKQGVLPSTCKSSFCFDDRFMKHKNYALEQFCLAEFEVPPVPELAEIDLQIPVFNIRDDNFQKPTPLAWEIPNYFKVCTCCNSPFHTKETCNYIIANIKLSGTTVPRFWLNSYCCYPLCLMPTTHLCSQCPYLRRRCRTCTYLGHASVHHDHYKFSDLLQTYRDFREYGAFTSLASPFMRQGPLLFRWLQRLRRVFLDSTRSLAHTKYLFVFPSESLDTDVYADSALVERVKRLYGFGCVHSQAFMRPME